MSSWCPYTCENVMLIWILLKVTKFFISTSTWFFLIESEGFILMLCKYPVHYHILSILLSYVVDRVGTLMLEVLIFHIVLLVMICIRSPLVIFWKEISMCIYICLCIKLPITKLLYSNPYWSDITHNKLLKISPFIIATTIHAPHDSNYIFSHIHVYSQSSYRSNMNCGVLLYWWIIPADILYLTLSSPVC